MKAPTRPPEEWEKSRPLQISGLAEYRAAALRRRAEAFCEAPQSIMGVAVRPLTPAVFSMLVAIRSPFVSGGAIQFEDVINYLWLNSPDYCHTGTPGWARRKRRALAPFLRLLTNRWRRFFWRLCVAALPRDTARVTPIEHAASVVALAIVEIRASIAADFADLPPASSDAPASATLEASLIHAFADAYHWPPERTRHTPIRQLLQLHRCIRLSHGEEVADAGELDLLAAHLRRRNAELAARSAKKLSAVSSQPSAPNLQKADR